MTTELLVVARVPSVSRHSGPVVGRGLREIHRRWLDETRDWLAPATSAEADFWNGWSAVRYLDDQFQRLYRRQLAFVRAIFPLLTRSEAYLLGAKTAQLERVRRNLDRLGRQQGMVSVVAAACSYFLTLLEEWFEQIQRLTHGLTRADLPEPARRALGQLHAAIASRAELPSLANPILGREGSSRNRDGLEDAGVVPQLGTIYLGSSCNGLQQDSPNR
jgi:hypothetical protein